MKQIERTATIAWGPTEAAARLIAAGSVAGTLDFTFETTATLELLEWKPGDASPTLSVVGATHAPDRFHALAWGRHGPSDMGLVAGGLSNGVVSVWDPAAIRNGANAEPVATAAKHAGAVQGLDWNPTMTHLLASCGVDSQLLVWDVTTGKPLSVYSPGARVKAIADGVSCVAWNKSPAVPHILAGALSSGPCEIWDLKNKKQVIAFHDAKRSTRGGQRSLAWHPTEPTIIIQACDDDASPVALVWDLKHYAAPVAVLSGHTRGVAAVSWSGPDLSLALTSSRDGSSILWDVDTASVRSYLSPPSATAFHVQTAWAPLVRAHLASASSDGHVRVHAVVDPGMRGRPTAAAKLGPAPAWLRRPCGASFGFGGRLLKFNAASRTVHIQPVVTDADLVRGARDMQSQTGSSEQLIALCEQRSAASAGDEARVWALLGARLRGQGRADALLQTLALDTKAQGAATENGTAIDEAAAAAEAVFAPASGALWGDAEWEGRAGRLACAGDVRGAWKACAAAGEWATALLVAKELGGDAEYASCKASWRDAPALVTGLLPLLARNSDQIVATGSLREWRALAAAALSWGSNAPARLSTLAQRLYAENQPAAAQLCLIGADDVDGLASVWTGGASTTESVLRLLCATRAAGTHLAPNTSRLANFLSILADSLAAQGDMSGALYWLEQIDKPAAAPSHIRLLYERLRASSAPAVAPAPAPAAASARTAYTAAGPVRPAPVASPAPYAAATAAVNARQASPVPVPPQPLVHAMPVPVPMPMPVPVSATPVAPTLLAHAPMSAPNPVAPIRATPSMAVPLTPSVPAMVPSSASPAVAAAAPAPSNPAAGAACDRLTSAVESLGMANERANKLSVEVAKRLPSLRTKLETLPPAQTDGLVALLDLLSNALLADDAAQANALYTEAQQSYHLQLGSTGMLALKRCLDLVKK